MQVCHAGRSDRAFRDNRKVLPNFSLDGRACESGWRGIHSPSRFRWRRDSIECNVGARGEWESRNAGWIFWSMGLLSDPKFDSADDEQASLFFRGCLRSVCSCLPRHDSGPTETPKSRSISTFVNCSTLRRRRHLVMLRLVAIVCYGLHTYSTVQHTRTAKLAGSTPHFSIVITCVYNTEFDVGKTIRGMFFEIRTPSSQSSTNETFRARFLLSSFTQNHHMWILQWQGLHGYFSSIKLYALSV